MSQKSKEVKQPDAFITFSDRLIKAFEDNYKTILGAVFAIFIIGGIIALSGLYQSKQEKTSMDAYYLAEKSLKEKQEALLPKPNEEDGKKTEETKEELAKIPENLNKEFSTQIEQLKSVIKDNRGYKGAYLAGLSLSNLYFEYGMNDEAVKTLESQVDELSTKDFFYGLMVTRLGSTFAGMGNCEKANNYYDKVLAVEAHVHLHPVTMLNQAICFEKLDNTEKAKEVYQQISSKFADTQAARSAKTFLRLMSLKQSKQ